MRILLLLLCVLTPVTATPNEITANQGEDKAEKIMSSQERNIPLFMFEVGGGFFNSFIENFEKEYIIRTLLRAGVSLKTLGNFYPYYQYSRYPTEKKTPEEYIVDDFRGTRSFDFKQLIHNFGLRYIHKELVPMRNSISWFGAGLSILNVNNTSISTWTTRDLENGEFIYTDHRVKEISKIDAKGYFIEIGHMLRTPGAFSNGITSGFSLVAKYDSGIKDDINLGGISLYIVVHLLKF